MRWKRFAASAWIQSAFNDTSMIGSTSNAQHSAGASSSSNESMIGRKQTRQRSASERSIRAARMSTGSNGRVEGGHPRTICIVTPSHISANPRVVKEADALHGAGFEVHVVFAQITNGIRREHDAE